MKNTKYLLFFFLLCTFVYGIRNLLPTMLIGYIFGAVALTMFLHYFIQSINAKKDGLTLSILLFILLQLLYLCFDDKTINHPYIKMTTWSVYQKIFYVFLSFYFTYYLSRRGFIGKKHLMWFYWVFLTASLLVYFLDPFFGDTGIEVGTRNTAYDIVLLLPYLFLMKRNRSIVLIVPMLFLALYGVKRGAIVTSTVFTLYYLYNYLKEEGRNKTQNIVLFVTVGIVAFSVISDFVQTNEYFNYRLKETMEGREIEVGRGVVYGWFWDHFVNNDFIHQLFGEGNYSVARHFGLMAHNDYLEVLLDNGIIGLLFYLIFILNIYLFGRKKDLTREEKSICVSIAMMWALIICFSSMYNLERSSYFMLLLGYIKGSYERRQMLSQTQNRLNAA